MQKPGGHPTVSPLGGVLLIPIVQAFGSTDVGDRVRTGLGGKREHIVEGPGGQPSSNQVFLPLGHQGFPRMCGSKRSEKLISRSSNST